MLSALDPGSTVAMEATGKYHRLLANTAHCLGFHVLVLNPKDVHKYRDSISPRAKTDKVDSGTIADFAQVRNHTPYRPLPPVVEKLRNLVRLRSSLVKQRVAHNNQLSECPDDCEILSPIVDCIGVCVKQIDKKIVEMAKEFASFAPLLDVPGFGTLTSAYMLALLLSGTFRSSDSFVAFIGLDLRVRDSGKKAGKRCLTKRGDPEARRLLYLAALAASRMDGPFKQLYQRYRLYGYSSTQATVVVARKLARVAWAIHTKGIPYYSDRVLNPPLHKRVSLRTAFSIIARSRCRRERSRPQTNRQEAKETLCPNKIT